MFFASAENETIPQPAAVQAGVNVVVLAVSYKPEDMLDAIKDMEKKYDIKLVISHETEPLGTGLCVVLLKWRDEAIATFAFQSCSRPPCTRTRASR